MKLRNVATILFQGMLVSVSLPAVAQEADITVQVHDYVGVDAGVLDEAIEHAATVYDSAGFDTEWVRVPVKADPPADCEACRKRPGRTTVIMRIVPDEMIANFANSRHHIGFSLIPADGGFGYIGGVYFERVEEMAHRLSRKRALILGHVLAHEVGHLLLGAHSHSRDGIMCYPLTTEKVDRASQGQLRFLPKQVKRIASAVEKRAAAEQEVLLAQGLTSR
jgi:hypothetical protein